MEEYIIEVMVTPHYHDNISEPYFWALLVDKCGNKYNCGSGWAASPEEAYKQALNYYYNYHHLQL